MRTEPKTVTGLICQRCSGEFSARVRTAKNCRRNECVRRAAREDQAKRAARHSHDQREMAKAHRRARP